MSRALFLVSLIVGLTVVLVIAVVPASGVSVHYQTIPTRTSRPPTPASTDNGGGDDDENTKPPPEKATLTATSTSTPLSVTLAPTPEGSYLSAAVPCDANPTVQTLDRTNVRSGPGIEYDSIAMLVFLEVRPIVGRAEFSEWWLVELADGSTGWVSDQVVIVQGYTGYVPIADAPNIDGETPTPGPIWNPTPNPICTPPPSPTPTLTTEASPTPLPSLTATVTGQATILPSESSTSTATETMTPIMTTSSETETETSTPIPTITPSLRATSENSESGDFDTTWILFTGLGLVIVGGIWFLFRRRVG